MASGARAVQRSASPRWKGGGRARGVALQLLGGAHAEQGQNGQGEEDAAQAVEAVAQAAVDVLAHREEPVLEQGRQGAEDPGPPDGPGGGAGRGGGGGGPPGRRGSPRPRAWRSVPSRPPTAAAAARSEAPASSWAWASWSRGPVSLCRPLGPGRASTSPSTPAACTLRRHRWIVARGSPSAGASSVCSASPSSTSCTAAKRRPTGSSAAWVKTGTPAAK